MEKILVLFCPDRKELNMNYTLRWNDKPNVNLLKMALRFWQDKWLIDLFSNLHTYAYTLITYTSSTLNLCSDFLIIHTNLRNKIE